MVAVSTRIEVEFVPGSGTWVNLSARCKSTEIDHPPSGQGRDAEPTILTAVFSNAPDSTGFCPLTASSPAGTYYPNVVRDRRVRVYAVVGATSYLRFNGWADRWVPDASDGNPNTSTVTLTASCVLSQYARRKIMSMLAETAMGTSDNADYYPFDDSAGATLLRGINSAGDIGPAEVVMPNRWPGSLTLAPPDNGGHLTDGQIEFTRGDDNAPSPVLRIQLRNRLVFDLRTISAWVRLTSDPAGSTVGDDIFAVYNNAQERLWVFSAKVVAGNIVYQVYDDTGTVRTQLDTGAPREEGWHYFTLDAYDSTHVTIRYAAKGESTTTATGVSTFPYVIDTPTWLIVGGQMLPFQKGKQTNTFQGTLSSLLIQYTPSFQYLKESSPGVVFTADQSAGRINIPGDDLDTLLGGGFSSQPDSTPMCFTNANTNVLDAWREHTRTIGGILFTRPDGRRQISGLDDVRPTAVSLTLDSVLDLHMPAGGWVQTLDERPTRVTATGPTVSVTVVDEVAEALTGLRQEGPELELAAGSEGVALSAASMVMARKGARLSAFGVDATLTSTDKTAALFALLPGERIRVTNLPTAYMGVSYVDCFAAGWKEYAQGEFGLYQFTFDTDPADDPVEGVFDDAEYGRFAVGTEGVATVTGGTCVGNTGTGTLIVTSTSPITNTGAQFPMDLDWNGERVTASGVGGATSPQTFTITARGVAPSVARIHATGETIDIYHAATFAF